MAKADLKLVNFEKLDKVLRPRAFETRLHRNVKRSMEACGLIGESEIVKSIDAGEYAPNKMMTRFLKGSGRPLMDSGELKNSMTSAVPDWDEAIIGVLRRKVVRGDDGEPDDIINVAIIVHNGVKSIRVTEKMRRYLAARGVVLRTKKAIRIKGRPFLNATVKASAKRQYKTEWQKAIQRTLRGEG
jgi:hypothetical protein